MKVRSAEKPGPLYSSNAASRVPRGRLQLARGRPGLHANHARNLPKPANIRARARRRVWSIRFLTVPLARNRAAACRQYRHATERKIAKWYAAIGGLLPKQHRRASRLDRAGQTTTGPMIDTNRL